MVRLADPSLRTYPKAVLESSAGRHLIDAVLNTTVQKTLNLKDIRRLPIPLPPSYAIASISEISEALTDRIALLRETNATLEAIAQALFKSWFVDFDPVRAKQQGLAPTGMDEATAALFPESFEAPAMGPIPKGWRIGVVGDLVEHHRGSMNPAAQPEQLFEHFSLPAFDDGQRPAIEAGAAIRSNKTSVPSNAVLLSKLNPHIPRVWLPFGSGSHAVCSTEFLPMQPRNTDSKEFIYCAFSASTFSERLRQLVTGTSNSHQRVKPENVLTLGAVLPPAKLVEAFTAITRPMFEKVGRNRQQAQTLATLRDTLLPRLISGQLRLPAVGATSEA